MRKIIVEGSFEMSLLTDDDADLEEIFSEIELICGSDKATVDGWSVTEVEVIDSK